MGDPIERRSFLIHYARVLLREARARRHQRRFAAFLLKGAARARREARAIDTRPAQGSLFSALQEATA